MKKSFTIFVAVLFNYCIVFAQAPQKMSYQAVIRDAGSVLITSTVVGMQISILQGSPTGTLVYVETQTPTTNVNGLVSIEIGGGIGFDTINWANGPYFIKTETDPTGGTTYSIVGTSELLSVPYSLFSANGTPGPQGPQGPQGDTGVSITNSYIQNDSLYVILSNGQILNTGYVRGPQGLQGIDGVSVDTAFVQNDSLFITLSNGSTINAGYVKGPQGTSSGNSTNGTNGIINFASMNMSPNTTQYHIGELGGFSSEDNIGLIMPENFTFKNLVVSVHTNTLDGSTSFTLRKNGVSTPLTLTVTANSTGLFINGTDSVTVTMGDKITFEVTTGGTTGSIGFYNSAVEYYKYLQTPPCNGCFTHYIGEIYNGGIVFYLYKDTTGAEHGLIASLDDISLGTSWSNITSTLIGVTAQSNWNGLTNSNAIVSQSGHTSSAAQLCLDYSNNGNNDWYLPSFYELKLFSSTSFIISKVLENDGNPATKELSGNYWSSTEATSTYAYFLSIDGGSLGSSVQKSIAFYKVRAVSVF